MPYRSALLGCGPRAHSHAAAYASVDRAELVAACDLDANRRNAFGAAFAVDTYADLDHMLATVRPDIVHVVTQPASRVALLSRLADAAVPLVVVEKPVALTPADARAIATLGQSRKIVVNHQLRLFDYHQRIATAVADGSLGKFVSFSASCRGNLAQQGTHMMDLLLLLAGDGRPAEVLGAIYEGRFDTTHPAPAMATGLFTFDDDRRAALCCGTHAPAARDEQNHWLHCQVAANGERGHGWASIGQSWEIRTQDTSVGGPTGWESHDRAGQARLVEACCDWLDDDASPHPCRLESALVGLNALFGLVLSALERRPVALPCEPPDDLLDLARAAVERP